jgi:hypothetical protein
MYLCVTGDYYKESHKFKISDYNVSWRKLHSNGLHTLYSSHNIVRVIKSRRMRWAGHVESMGEGRGV